MRRRTEKGGRRRAVLGVLAFLLLIPAAPADAAPATESPPLPPAPISVNVVAGTGSGRIQQPGRPCSDGGDGACWHYDYGAPLAPGVFSSLAGETRAHLGAVDPTAGPVTVEDTDVAGAAARCFTVTPAGAAPLVACFDGDGVPVVIDGGGGRLERVSVEPTVDDSVFTPPPS
ncbi:MAG: hypothetical protein ACRD0U_12075 [Acidimicrobiales bacterium]